MINPGKTAMLKKKYFDSLIPILHSNSLSNWAEQLENDLSNFFTHTSHGDFDRWLSAFNELPEIIPDTFQLKSSYVGPTTNTPLSQTTEEQLHNCLKRLHPWRKGPYQLFNTHIDTEWHSDWKWDRVSPHLAPLKDRNILDIGCGNGYHCWRMLGEGAKLVIGVDPNQLFLFQFLALQKYINSSKAFLLPFGVEKLPPNLAFFDTVFSMGVLYHRKSPIDHLATLKGLLRQNGELVLETLIIPGGGNEVLVPKGRYAKMRNVWFIPTVDHMLNWLQRVGFKNARCVDITQTTTDEQRSTSWMTFESLPDFLDPQNANLTIEGYPAPTRATFIAENPSPHS